jgi:hypothetical protein
VTGAKADLDRVFDAAEKSLDHPMDSYEFYRVMMHTIAAIKGGHTTVSMPPAMRVNGAAAPHVDDDFQNGAKFLTMAIDRFRNEKSHTADGNITDPIRAYEYLRLSSLAMHLLDRAHIPSGSATTSPPAPTP